MKNNMILFSLLIMIISIFLFASCTSTGNNVGNTDNNLIENTGVNDYLVDTNGIKNDTGLTDPDGIPESVDLPGTRNILPPYRYVNIKYIR